MTDYIILIHRRGDYLTNLKSDGEIFGGSAEDALGYSEEQAKALCEELGNCSYQTRESATQSGEF